MLDAPITLRAHTMNTDVCLRGDRLLHSALGYISPVEFEHTMLVPLPKSAARTVQREGLTPDLTIFRGCCDAHGCAAELPQIRSSLTHKSGRRAHLHAATSARRRSRCRDLPASLVAVYGRAIFDRTSR